MSALEVRLNGNKVCTAGIERQGAVWVGLRLTSLVDHEEAQLNVDGFECDDLNGDWRRTGRAESLSWHNTQLNPGDTLTIQIVEGTKVTTPKTRERHEAVEAADPATQEKNHRALFELLKSKYGW